MSILGSKEIRRRILEEDLITNYIDLEIQLQPNGFDLTVAQVSTFKNMGELDFDNSKRKIPEYQLRLSNYSEENYWLLEPGAYAIRFNETVNLPLNIMADSIHRSSLMRCGAVTASGRWDTGYQGQGQTLLIVHNPHGMILYKNARIVQMMFMRTDWSEKGYNGKYQREKIR